MYDDDDYYGFWSGDPCSGDSVFISWRELDSWGKEWLDSDGEENNTDEGYSDRDDEENNTDEKRSKRALPYENCSNRVLPYIVAEKFKYIFFNDLYQCQTFKTLLSVLIRHGNKFAINRYTRFNKIRWTRHNIFSYDDLLFKNFIQKIGTYNSFLHSAWINRKTKNEYLSMLAHERVYRDFLFINANAKKFLSKKQSTDHLYKNLLNALRLYYLLEETTKINYVLLKSRYDNNDFEWNTLKYQFLEKIAYIQPLFFYYPSFIVDFFEYSERENLFIDYPSYSELSRIKKILVENYDIMIDHVSKSYRTDFYIESFDDE